MDKKNVAKKKKSQIWIGGLLLFFIALFVVLPFISAQAGDVPADVAGKVVSINVTETLDVSGSLEAQPFASLTWNTSGVVEEVYVEAGDIVKAGDVLLKLNETSVSSNIRSAQGELVTAQKELDDLLSSTDQDLAQAVIDLKDAQEAYDKANNYLKYLQTSQKVRQTETKIFIESVFGKYQYRYKTRVFKGPAPTDWIIDAQNDLALKKAQLEDAQRAYDRIKDGPNIQDMRAAQATVDLMSIIAPFDGEILYVESRPGDAIDTSTTALDMADLNHLYIEAQVNEADIVRIRVGYRVQVNDLVSPLTVRGQTVGYLVLQQSSIADRFMFVRAIFIPISIIMFFLAVFLVIVATLLIRRFVNPLADMIFAAREVADGKLDTRIPKKGPQDLQSLSESFNEMASSLERSDRERRDMLADIAHELRTPLSVIRGRLEGIVDGIYSENGSQISMALEQTYLLQRLVDDLRLLTLAETRQLQFDKRNVHVGNVVERVLEMFSAEAQEKNILLSFSERNGNLSAFIDPQRFEQVLSNLIGNSLRYVPEAGKIWITANETHSRVRLTVNDNGPGISEEDLPFIFDRFWRKEKSRARATGGTGLGLAIAKQLFESQDGATQARNLPEGGLQIELELAKAASS